MNTFSMEELDRQEIEFLPPRVVMTVCQPRCAPAPCYVPKCEPVWCEPQCAPAINVCADVRVDCLVRVNLGLRLL